MNNFDELLAEPVPGRDIEAERREQFRQANASQALEGLQMDANDLAIQEKVIKGELTSDQAVAEYLKQAKRGV